MLTLCQFRASLCCLGGGPAQEDHASVFIAVGRHVPSFLSRLMWMLIAARVACIAFFEPGDCLRRGNNRLVRMSRISSTGKLVVANYTKQSKEEWKVCLCHDVLSFRFVKMIGWSAAARRGKSQRVA